MSFKRFMRQDFDHALSHAAIWTQLCDHYRAFPPDLSLCLDYERIVSDPHDVAARIGTFLGLGLKRCDIANAVTPFERDKVRLRIEALASDAKRRHAARDVNIADALILHPDGTTRFCDLQTGFQSDHVSDCREGDWRILLTPDQQRRLDQTIGDWLTHHGYNRRLAS